MKTLISRLPAALAGLAQAGVFVLIWLLAQRVVELTGLPLPASIVGLGAAVLLLRLRVLRERHVAAGAGLLLGDMLLFFIPPLLAVMQFGPLLEAHGLQLFAAVAGGSLFVLACTGWLVERTLRWERARALRRPRQGAEPCTAH